MKIDVIPFAKALDDEGLTGKIVVVIDILRATSVIVTALQNGANQIVPALSVESAFEKRKAFKSGEALLCGERNAEKIEGFDLGNSPLQFNRDVIEGKTIIQTTSNGTKALHACKGAKEVLVGSFLNLEALVKRIADEEQIVLVCSGTLDKFSIDDAMAAAAIIDEISVGQSPILNDLGQSVLLAYRQKKGNLNELLKDCVHLNYLKSKGYEKDVEFCLQKNKFNIVPVFDQEESVVYRNLG